MRTIKILLLAVIASLMFAGCGNNAKTPSEITKKVFIAAINLDFNTIKQYLIEERIERLEETEKDIAEDVEYANKLKKTLKNVTFKVVSETISQDGNSAVVVIEVFNPAESDSGFEKEIKCTKVNDEWKVDSNPF